MNRYSQLRWTPPVGVQALIAGVLAVVLVVAVAGAPW
jgi:hypothetical protein